MDFDRLGAEVLVNTATDGDQALAAMVGLTGSGFVVVWTDASLGAGGAGGDSDGLAVKAQLYDSSGKPSGGEILVNTGATGDQSAPKVAALTGGGFAVAWQDASTGKDGAGGDGEGLAIKSQVFDAKGQAVGSEILVNTAVEGDQVQPHIAALSGGGFVVVWSDEAPSAGGADGDASGRSVKAQVFDAEGKAVDSERLINSATEGDQYDARVSALPKGGFVVTWRDDGQGQGGAAGDTSGAAIKAQVLGADGALAGEERLVNESVVGDQTDPEITVLKGGGFVIVWRDAGDPKVGGDGEGLGVKAQIFDADGGAVGHEIQVNSTTGGDQTLPKVAALTGGGFAVVWEDHSGAGGDSSGASIKAQVFSAEGSPGKAEILVNTATDGEQTAPTLQALSGGGFVVAWQSTGKDGDGDGLAIKAQAFDADGQAVGDERLVNSASAGDQSDPVLASLADDGFVAAWRDASAGKEDASGLAVKAQLFEAVADVIPNAAPVLGGLGGSTSFTEGGASASNPVAIAPGLTVSDADSAALASARVAITGGFHAAEDRLAFANVAGMGDIAGAYDSGTGVLTLTSPSAGASLAQWQAALRAVTFSDISQAPNTAARTLSFTVNDGGADSSTLTQTVSVTAVNDAPAGTSATLTLLEDGARVLSASDLGFSDLDGGTLAGVKITTLPGAGSLTNNGVAVTAGQTVSAADLAASRLVFTPGVNLSGAGYASLTFQVQDNGGTASGGVDLDPSANTLTFNVTAVNDAPSGTNATRSLAHDTSRVLVAGDFGFSDTDGGTLAAVKITSLPGAGALKNDGVAVTANQVVALADITAGKLIFTPAAGASGTAYASFGFAVRDSGGTANGGQDLDTSPNTLTFDVTAAAPTPAPPTPPIITSGDMGTGANDHAVFGGGGDVFYAGGGNDEVSGGDGDDVLQGNAGDDDLSGDAGDDIIHGGKGDDHIDGGVGDDYLTGDLGSDTLDGGEGSNYVRGGEGDDHLTGGSGFDDLNGNQGNDLLRGGAGGDWVAGGKGDDEVHGEAGDDLVSGDRGDDQVWGEAGADTLTGGQGADIFHSFDGAGLDLITDFKAEDGDRVQLTPGTTYTLAQVGADTVIEMAGGQVVLAGVQLSALGAGWLLA